MPRDHEQLTPTPFEPAPAGSPQKTSPSRGRSAPAWVLPVLGLLLVAALAVLLWRPDPASPPPPAPAGASSEMPDSAPGADTTARETPPSSPWADAQQARLRKAAQDALQSLLERQYALEEAAVTQWAGEAFAAARETAEAGDALYQSREYAAATERYESADAALASLQEALPARADAQRETVRQALEQREAQAAAQGLALATGMAPEHPDLAALEERLAALPAVIDALESAQRAEQRGKLEAALASLEQAIASDPAHRYAATEQQRVAQALKEQQFQSAMSEGYAALANERFDSARAAFRRARELRPGATEAANALREVDTAATASELRKLRQQGQTAEAAEQWELAESRYAAALAIDPTLVFAQEGLARARPRAALDAQLQEVLEKPERLFDPTVAAATEKLLTRARARADKGPRLEEQLARIGEALAVARRPMPVTLRSDGETRVTVYRVARLGSFEERQLELRPGTYTAVGSRRGYRDVRHTFTVAPDQPPPPVVVICTETI